MKIALIHDHLTCKAGGEQVALTFHKAFPQAPIFTLAYNREATFPEFKNCDIRSSWFQSITNDEHKLKKLFFPLGILAMRTLYLVEYDVVLITGTHCGKYVRFSPNTVVINYCFTPFRLAWNPDSYSQFSESKTLSKLLLKQVVSVLKFWDKRFAERVDHFIAMTKETQGRIVQAYEPRNSVPIINPPVNNLEKYSTHNDNGSKGYFLIVSRLEYYKKVDLAIKVFNNLEHHLVVVGKGSKESELIALADSKKVTFMKNVSTEDLATLYAGCRAFIFPQYEDYGLTALEANASGRPVIAFRKGGVLDTQKEFDETDSSGTAIFFDTQDEVSLRAGIQRFEKLEPLFSSKDIRRHAEGFSEEKFIAKIRAFVNEKASIS
ncbi:MAG TPA: glycosyltransferase [Leadbetterella sp.]|nr:glycosyltransferase [Leadbetterella sp.]